MRGILVATLIALAAWQLAAAAWIDAKAIVAQRLIGHAWSRSSSAGGEPVKPWPWADTWPVARLQVPAHGKDLYVLAGASGHALAFGPGLEMASSLPGATGVSVIGGHRDTHFAFLRELRAGSLIRITLPGGEWHDYQVAGSHIVDAARETLPLHRGLPSQLLLVTCYPFNTVLAGGSLRYVVSARPLGKPALPAYPL
jgi:sortase A